MYVLGKHVDNRYIVLNLDSEEYSWFSNLEDIDVFKLDCTDDLPTPPWVTEGKSDLVTCISLDMQRDYPEFFI